MLWLAVWEPLRRDADTLRAARAVNAAELAAARKMTEEAAGLARTPAAPAPPIRGPRSIGSLRSRTCAAR